MSPFLAAIEERVAQRLISKRRHDDLPLTIYNYTAKAQYDRVWDEWTLMCRGLIVDDVGTIVARPFPKFFNLGETDAVLPDEPYVLTEKMDGSLIIATLYEGQLVMASRGSFDGEHANAARNIVMRKYPDLSFRMQVGRTYLFELLWPPGRIVVDYGDREDLVLLAVLDTETGAELPLEDLGPPHVTRYDELTLETIVPRDNAEGYVATFAGGHRVKVKHPEYIVRHRLLTGLDKHRVWEWLSEGRSLDAMAEICPDEVMVNVRAWEKELISAAYEVLDEISSVLPLVPRGTRKESALYILEQRAELRPLLFAALDNKPFLLMAWKVVEPVRASA